MLVLMVGYFDFKTTSIPDSFFEYRHKVLNDGSPAIINGNLLFRTTDFCTAVCLDSKPDPATAGMLRGKAVHIKYCQVDACRCSYGDGALYRFEHILLLLKAEGLEVPSRGECRELVLHEI